MEFSTLLLGLLIFLARVVDVSLGTIRTIVIVQGKTLVAFVLGFIEVLIWITIVSTVVHRITETPVLVLFYALGFATGNVVGIIMERRRMPVSKSPACNAPRIAIDVAGARQTEPEVNALRPKSRKWSMIGRSPMPLMR